MHVLHQTPKRTSALRVLRDSFSNNQSKYIKSMLFKPSFLIEKNRPNPKTNIATESCMKRIDCRDISSFYQDDVSNSISSLNFEDEDDD